jgi:heme a synthase
MEFSLRRPVPRWLHVWAILSVVATALLLVVGGFVTTFRVGMADPVWPTEPWYLFGISWSEPSAGFLIEHTHRLLGFLVGGLMSILAIGIWAVQRKSMKKWIGLIGLIVLLALFGEFHRALLKQADAPIIVWPMGPIAGLVIVLICLLAVALVDWKSARTGAGLRLLVLISLVAVMTQGLLGGFRVRLNALAGTDLAAVHGSFAQIVFALLVAVALLTGTAKRERGLPAEVARKLRWQTLCLLLFTYLQIVWGAWIRHFPGPLSNRLHLFFAFVVVAFATLTIKQALSDPIARERFKLPARFLMGLITFQVLLGIEAWLGKFLTGTLPELEQITAGKALVRTAHAHVGTWVLGMSVIFYLIARRKPAEAVGPASTPSLNLGDASSPLATSARSI